MTVKRLPYPALKLGGSLFDSERTLMLKKREGGSKLMPVGIIVNCLAVVIGGAIGSLLGERISPKLRNSLTMVFGACWYCSAPAGQDFLDPCRPG